MRALRGKPLSSRAEGHARKKKFSPTAPNSRSSRLLAAKCSSMPENRLARNAQEPLGKPKVRLGLRAGAVSAPLTIRQKESSRAAPALDVQETPTTADVMVTPQIRPASPPRAARKICTECRVAIAGSVYMLNDLSYCCERHRLAAFRRLELPEGPPPARLEAPPPSFVLPLPTLFPSRFI